MSTKRKRKLTSSRPNHQHPCPPMRTLAAKILHESQRRRTKVSMAMARNQRISTVETSMLTRSLHRRRTPLPMPPLNWRKRRSRTRRANHDGHSNLDGQGDTGAESLLRWMLPSVILIVSISGNPSWGGGKSINGMNCSPVPFMIMTGVSTRDRNLCVIRTNFRSSIS